MAKVLDDAALALIGGGAFLFLAPNALGEKNARVARLLGAGLALGGLLRAFAAARDELGRPLAIASTGLEVVEKLADLGKQGADATLALVPPAIERAAEAAADARDDALANVFGPPAPPSMQEVPAPSGELVAPHTQAREPYIATDVGFAASSLSTNVGAVLLDPPNGGEQDIGAFDRYFTATIELRNYTDAPQSPVVEYVAKLTPLGPFLSGRTVRGLIREPSGKALRALKPREVRRINALKIDIGGRDVVNVSVSLALLVNNVQVQSTGFVLT